MSALELAPAPDRVPLRPFDLPVETLGELVAVGRAGGQGRVYRPVQMPAALGRTPLVVKIYRRAPSAAAVHGLVEMVAWSRALAPEQRVRLRRAAAWPLAVATDAGRPVGIAMHDVSGRFEVPFVMPSGRRQRVLLSLEHLLGPDHYLRLRGLPVTLTTSIRVQVAEQISGALAFLHRHAIVAGDIAPNNVLVAFGPGRPAVCFIDCDSMVLQGRQALAAVETADWQMPRGLGEPPRTRAADAYKLGLIVLRLLARSHDARVATPHLAHVPAELRAPLQRALGPDPANRPPAGEWQRALREALATGTLDRRAPGPRSAPATPAPRAPARRVEAPATIFRAPAPRTAVPSARRPQQRLPRIHRAQRSLSLVWLVVVVVVLWLAFARLMSAAAPTSTSAGLDSGGSGRPSVQFYDPSQFGR